MGSRDNTSSVTLANDLAVISNIHRREFKWELYNIADDYSEADNLAEKNPEKLKELQTLFYAEAKKNNVLPLDASFAERVDPSIRPSLTKGRTSFEYYEGAFRIPEGSAPDFKNQSWTITADVNTAQNHRGYWQPWVVISGLCFNDERRQTLFMYRGSNQPQWLVTLKCHSTWCRCS